MQPALTINTLQSNPLSNYTTSRHLSRPPLQTIPTITFYHIVLLVQTLITHKQL